MGPYPKLWLKSFVLKSTTRVSWYHRTRTLSYIGSPCVTYLFSFCATRTSSPRYKLLLYCTVRSDVFSSQAKMAGIDFVDSNLFESARLVSRHWCLALAILLVFSFPITFLVTSAISYLQRQRKGNGVEPPTYPYSIPFLGHAIKFSRDRMSFFGQIK